MNNNWFKNPSRKQVIICFIIYFICMGLYIYAGADFTNQKTLNLLLLLLIGGPSVSMLKLFFNYKKNNK